MLNVLLINLRLNAIRLQVEDVKAQYRQGYFIFASIIVPYKARCRICSPIFIPKCANLHHLDVDAHAACAWMEAHEGDVELTTLHPQVETTVTVGCMACLHDANQVRRAAIDTLSCSTTLPRLYTTSRRVRFALQTVISCGRRVTEYHLARCPFFNDYDVGCSGLSIFSPS